MTANGLRVIGRSILALSSMAIALITALETFVALKFQFPSVRAFDFGLLWPAGSEVPKALISGSMFAGAILWAGMAGEVWREIIDRKPGSFTACEAIIITLVALVPAAGIIVGPFGFAVWLNALAAAGIFTAHVRSSSEKQL